MHHEKNARTAGFAVENEGTRQMQNNWENLSIQTAEGTLSPVKSFEPWEMSQGEESA